MLLYKGWVVVQVQVQPNKGGISNPIRGAAPICWGMRRWGVVGEGCSPTEKQNELVIKMLLVTSFCRVFESNMTTMITMIETVIKPYYRAAPTPHCQGWRRSSNEGRCSLKRWKFYTSESSSSSSSIIIVIIVTIIIIIIIKEPWKYQVDMTNANSSDLYIFWCSSLNNCAWG